MALSIHNVLRTTSYLAYIDRSFQIGPGLHHALINGTAAPLTAQSVLIVIMVCIWQWPHQSLHLFDLVRVRGQISLIFPAIDNFFVVRPSYLLVG